MSSIFFKKTVFYNIVIYIIAYFKIIYVFLSLKKFHLKCAAQSLRAVVMKIPAVMAIPVPSGFQRTIHTPAPITDAHA